ncbi:MAG: hypothetical protein A2X04_10960 [Bacteroidetes bacterium GWF2_41_9]|nr:MAG: hypothetical protein A2X06_06355 [Bacteroidetes bacterium GWC2_40_22]OFY57235.1 MAG: hypothetical protein A2X04_10960 [Bacteroidetes bacterium GWF2_41_9]
MSDYCYSDRLLSMMLDQSATHGFQVKSVTTKPSGCPFIPPYGGTSGTKCHSGSFARFPKEVASVSDNH